MSKFHLKVVQKGFFLKIPKKLQKVGVGTAAQQVGSSSYFARLVATVTIVGADVNKHKLHCFDIVSEDIRVQTTE